MDNYPERVNLAVINTTECPRCKAKPGEHCKNNSINMYYPPHVVRYDEWIEHGRPFDKR